MRRPIRVKSFECSSPDFFVFPFSQAASVATLPSALLCERFSLGASWVFSIPVGADAHLWFALAGIPPAWL